MKRVACIGSRETPPIILDWMKHMGAMIVRAGYVLVSGNAPGADQAWANGGNAVDPSHVELCLPWEYFEAAAIDGKNRVRKLHADALGLIEHERYYDLVRQTHPAFGRLSKGDLQLHARNAMIVDGAHVVLGHLNPMKPGGGGTGSAFRIAHRLGIQALNVADPFTRAGVEKRLSTAQDVRCPMFTVEKAKKW